MTKHKHVAALAGGVLCAVAALVPALSYGVQYAYAFTDNSVVPSVTDGLLSATFVASDVATCLASNPSDDRFELQANYTTGPVDVDALFAGFTGPVTLATSTAGSSGDPTGGYVGCADGVGGLDSGAPYVLYNNGFLYDSLTTFQNFALYTPPASPYTLEATSTADQIQQDWLGVWFVFFCVTVFVVWLMRKR